MTKFWMCLCKVTKPSWPSLLSLKYKFIPFTLVIWLSRVCKTQKIDFRFLHLEYWNIWALGWCIFSLWPCFFCTCICLYGWSTWYFCLCLHIFSWHLRMRECLSNLFSFFALGNFTFFLDLRINFISIFLHCKWHGRNIWVWNVLLWRAALLHSREVPGRSVDFSLAVGQLP